MTSGPGPPAPAFRLRATASRPFDKLPPGRQTAGARPDLRLRPSDPGLVASAFRPWPPSSGFPPPASQLRLSDFPVQAFWPGLPAPGARQPIFRYTTSYRPDCRGDL